MDLEPFDFEETLRQRKASATASIREVSYEEVLALEEKLATDHGSPIGAQVREFISENRNARAYGGETSDGICFLYYPKLRRGMWYSWKSGVRGAGKLGARGMDMLDEILAKRG